MKDKLVSVFTRGYVFFTIVLILILAGIFYLDDIVYYKLTSVPDTKNMIEDKALLAGDFDNINKSEYLGEDDLFAVAAEDGSVLYRSSDRFPEKFTEDELKFIPDHNAMHYVECTQIDIEGRKPGTLIVNYRYGDRENYVEDAVILDEEYNVTTQTGNGNKKKYTEKELSYLEGKLGEDNYIEKAAFRSDSGKTQYLLTAYSAYGTDSYTSVSRKSAKVYLLLIPLYIIALFAFLFWLDRKIRVPLISLDKAVNAIANGGDFHTGDMKGPWEIRMIGKNIDSMAEKLKLSEDERLRTDQEKQKLIADISHDLKTPVTVISGYARALRDGKIDDEKRDNYLELIEKKTEELTRLVNSLHDYSKVQHPDFMLEMKECDICEFMRTYIAERYDEIDMAGFCLRADIPEKKIMARLDIYNFRRALDNIIYNAIRHNSLGTVMLISVSPERKSGRIRINIADNGSGIPEDRRSNIFDPFVKGEDSRTGEGSGLGLSITKRIVDAHGGEIRLCDESERGFSTDFEITLPEIKNK